MRVTLLFALGLLLAACADGVSIDDDDNGGAISVMVTDRSTIELEANPSTGYTWVVEKSDGLRLLTESWSGDSDLVGAPGISTFEFEAEEPGTNRLEMVYTRTWTEDDPLDRVFSLTVEVTE